MKDELGNRMKTQYEDRTRFYLPRRTNTIIRVDGRAFHTFTRKFTRPYDVTFMDAMNDTALAMCEDIQGAKLAYVQSDEISILLTDYDKVTTEAWFDGNIQKMVSISAALATAAFNDQFQYWEALPKVQFDSRVFTIPDWEEVINYFIWRQKDATRNSISMAAQSEFSHRDLHGKSQAEMQDLLVLSAGINWNDYPEGFKRGRVFKNVEGLGWQRVDCPIFTADRDFITGVNDG